VITNAPGALAIVLARGGSRGLPRKNVLPVADRPCIEWTIEHAQQASRVGRVLVSSDDDEVMTIARRMGAETHEREHSLATDTATIDAAARSACAFADGATDRTPDPHDAIVLLYGNVPVRPLDLIDRALEVLAESGCDSVQSYAPVGKHHPWWTARLGEGGSVAPWEGSVLNHNVFRRQDLPPAFVPDGGVIALTRRALFLRVEGVQPGPHAFFGLDRRGIETREGDVVDIDTRTDLLVADALLRERTEHARAHR